MSTSVKDLHTVSDVITGGRKCARGLNARGRSIVSELELSSFSLSFSLFLSHSFILQKNLGRRKEIFAHNDGGTTDHWLSCGSLGLMKRFSRTAATERSTEGRETRKNEKKQARVGLREHGQENQDRKAGGC